MDVTISVDTQVPVRASETVDALGVLELLRKAYKAAVGVSEDAWIEDNEWKDGVEAQPGNFEEI